MIIDREVDYSLRLIRALRDGQRRPVKQVCEDEQVPWKFGYKIVRKLRDAGIIDSVSGVNGGCMLTADLQTITLLDLIDIIDSDRKYVADCLKPGYQCNWTAARCRACPVNSRLKDIQASISGQLARYTLAELLREDNQ